MAHPVKEAGCAHALSDGLHTYFATQLRVDALSGLGAKQLCAVSIT